MNEAPLPIRNTVTNRKVRDAHAPIQNMSRNSKADQEKPVHNSVQKKHGK